MIPLKMAIHIDADLKEKDDTYDKTDLQDNDVDVEEAGSREMEPTNFEADLGASQWEY